MSSSSQIFRPIMAELGGVGQHVAVGPAHEKGPSLPFSAASNSEWEAAALEQSRAVTDKRTLALLNGRRATAWRICVEKKRKELAAIFGISPGTLAEFPPDCRGKVLEFLAPEPSSGMLTPAEWNGLAKKREGEIVDKWVGILLESARESAMEDGWTIVHFRALAISEENAGNTLNILGAEDPKWWEFEPLLEKLRALGYEVEVGHDEDEDQEDESPPVLTLGPPLAV